MTTESSARKVPSWAAGLIEALARDRPAVVTRDDLRRYLVELGSSRETDQVASDLQQSGWLTTLHLKGVWGFVPPGESAPLDPYLDLRGWQARDPEAVFFLAGEAAGWHLGYLQRQYTGPIAVWLPYGERVPHGLRPGVSQVGIRWSPEQTRSLGPSVGLLHRKGLDVTRWAGGLPAFGPDALMAQIAIRPSSMRSWADLVANLDVLADDSKPENLASLLSDQSASAWQRCGYLLHCGGRTEDGIHLLDQSPYGRRATAQFGKSGEGVWSREFGVHDRVVAPLKYRMGNA